MALKRNDVRIEFAIIALIVLMGAMLIGCAIIENIPTPQDVLRKPMGTESIKIGMSKAQVESLWGKPDDISMVENKDRWGGAREMWVYTAQYDSIPVNAGYLSKTQKLYFDGDNLTNISE